MTLKDLEAMGRVLRLEVAGLGEFSLGPEAKRPKEPQPLPFLTTAEIAAWHRANGSIDQLVALLGMKRRFPDVKVVSFCPGE